MVTYNDVFGARTILQGTQGPVSYYRLSALAEHGVRGLERLPFTVKIILENLLRHAGGELVTKEDVLSLANWQPGQTTTSNAEYPFLPARVLLQDFTGVPAVADLAAMRSAVSRMQGDPQKINPLVPADHWRLARMLNVNMSAMVNAMPYYVGVSRLSAISAWFHRALVLCIR